MLSTSPRAYGHNRDRLSDGNPNSLPSQPACGRMRSRTGEIHGPDPKPSFVLVVARPDGAALAPGRSLAVHLSGHY